MASKGIVGAQIPKTARIKFYPAEVAALILDPEVFDELDRRMGKARKGAQRRVRVRTGRLMTSIRLQRGVIRKRARVDVVAGWTGVRSNSGVGSGRSYVMFEHDGTQAHEIRPRRRKALRYVDATGAVVFRKRVWHPGTTGTEFLTRSLPLAAG